MPKPRGAGKSVVKSLSIDLKSAPLWTDTNYVQQLHRYERQLRSVGMSKLHGLRHADAQQRYLELTGWKAPVAGGPASDSLTTDQRALDSKARAMISCELGHAREAISAVYLGR